ncbi:MAG: undecaprenyl-diphosphate phosphatase [Bacteroidetes bacterium]|nr:MAG: undecaprenyl-diphosphate phosphatase [Bacteroidota bacterium]
MTILEAIILGIIQGITEFLPISSDGHLMIASVLMGITLEKKLLFDAVLHMATTLSIIVVFWKDIVTIVRDLFKFQWNENTKLSMLILVSMIPAGFAGILLKHQIEGLQQATIPNLILTGAMLILSGVFLWLSTRIKAGEGELNPLKAFIIGVFQAAAMLPGLSRSGSTISASLALGVEKVQTTRFVFLMVIPVILGGTLLELKDFLEPAAVGAPSANAVGVPQLIVGFITSFVFGLIACTWMVRLVKKAKLDYFAIYCFIVGALAIVWGLMK